MRRLAEQLEFSGQHRDTQIRLGVREIRLKSIKLVSGFRQALERCSLLSCHWPVGNQWASLLDRSGRREAPSLQSGCRFLSQTHQRQPHRVIKVGGGEVGVAELQLVDEAPEEYAALFYRQAGGGRPDRSKLRIRQNQHAVMLGVTDVNFLTNQGGGKRRCASCSVDFDLPGDVLHNKAGVQFLD